MALTILSKLRGVRPDGHRVRNESLRAVHEFVREHLSEIEDAYKRGYSWEQIDTACWEVWSSDPARAAQVYWWTTGNLTEYSYHVVKKSSAAGQTASTR